MDGRQGSNGFQDNLSGTLGGQLFLEGGVIVKARILYLFKILATELPLGIGLEHAPVNQTLLFFAQSICHQFLLHFLSLYLLLSFLSHLSQQLCLSIVVQDFKGGKILGLGGAWGHIPYRGEGHGKMIIPALKIYLYLNIVENYTQKALGTFFMPKSFYLPTPAVPLDGGQALPARRL